MSTQAEQLRAEIWRQLRINEHKGEFFPDAADNIINKILGAVIESAPEGIDGGNHGEDDYAGGWNHALNAFEKSIKSLKAQQLQVERME